MRNAFRIFRRDMKRLLRSPAAVLVMIGVCIIPLSVCLVQYRCQLGSL